MAARVLDGQPFRGSGGKQRGVGTDECGSGQSICHVIVTAGEGAGKLDGVIGAQGMRTAEISRPGDNTAINGSDDISPLNLLPKADNEPISIGAC